MPASMRHLNQLVIERQRQPQAKKSITSALARWHKDQKFYAIEVLACDKKERKCKVQFEDNYDCWMDASDIHLQLCLDELKDELIVCCACDDGLSKTPNEIVICDTCQQGYHLGCHKPTLDRATIELDDEEATWSCATCSELLQLPDTASGASQQTQLSVAAKAKSQKTTESSVAKENNSARKSRAMKPKSLNNGSSNGQKTKKAPKIKLAKRAVAKKGEADGIPSTASMADTVCAGA